MLHNGRRFTKRALRILLLFPYVFSSINCYRVAQKLASFLYALTYQILTDFQNYFTVRIRRKFVIILWL